MTCAFTRRFGCVYACDLDAGFLERCRQAVARFGKVARLRTIEVIDGRTLAVPDDAADVAFSYITLQHCDRDDAFALVDEALRVVKPGGQIALNFRSWSGTDPDRAARSVRLIRVLFRMPVLGPWLSRRRTPTRLAWQANRLDPHQVLATTRDRLREVDDLAQPGRDAQLWGVNDAGHGVLRRDQPQPLVARRPS